MHMARFILMGGIILVTLGPSVEANEISGGDTSSSSFSIQHLSLRNNNHSDPDSTNTSGVKHAVESDFYVDFEIAITLMYILLCIVAVLGNSCVIYVVVSRRRMRNVTNYFIVSLAISDILMALVCIPFTSVADVLFGYWPFYSWLCPVIPYFQAVVVFQNAYTLLAMSLERYIAIMHPFLPRLGMRRCLQVVVLCWVLAVLTPIPTAVTSGVLEENGTHQCQENWATEEQRMSYSATIMLLQYFVPLAVLVFTYARIVHVIWLKDDMPRPSQMLGPSQNETDVLPSDKATDPRKKVIKMMITVVGIYCICWLPIHSLTIYADVDNSIYLYRYYRAFWISAHWLAMSSCSYNPFIYWWMNPKFREGYIGIFRHIQSGLSWCVCLCTKRRSSYRANRFFSKLPNGSCGTCSSRRLSSTQMMEFTASFTDGPRRGETSILTDGHGKEVEFIPELSKISEVTENGASVTGSRQPYHRHESTSDAFT